MFEYILSVFGLKSVNNFSNKFFTGIVYTVLSVFLIQIPLTFVFLKDTEFLDDFIEINLTILYASLFNNFLFICQISSGKRFSKFMKNSIPIRRK